MSTSLAVNEGKRMSSVFKAAAMLLLVIVATVARAGTVTYVYTDPQGTPLAEADASGAITATFDYKPYGTPVASMSGAPNGPGYTGHVDDPDTGLVYMQARYYDPQTARFISTDPVKADPKTGGRRSPYEYADDNPVRFVDPDGRYTCSGSEKFCAKVDAYVAALKQARENLKNSPNTRGQLTLVQKALTQIGEKGKGGPEYVSGLINGRPSAHTNQNGTTTIDTAKLDLLGSRAAQVGAQVIAHEARHDIDVKDGGIKVTEVEVRKTEENAYDTSRAVDRGFGLQWTQQQYKEAVDASVQSWLDQQGTK